VFIAQREEFRSREQTGGRHILSTSQRLKGKKNSASRNDAAFALFYEKRDNNALFGDR
jgi:hypothetical protein